MADAVARTTDQKVRLFGRFFVGLRTAYGTYDPASGRAFQIKRPVTDDVILAHLSGQQPYGVYLLVHDRTRAIVVDFDTDELARPMDFVESARHYGLSAYIERSKSKGYHVWVFFAEDGASAAMARLVVSHILAEIGRPHTEVFPKQDSLRFGASYGNFINAPLFGRLVPQGRTVFVDPADPTKPSPNQWAFLEQVERVPESVLEEVIQVNELGATAGPQSSEPASAGSLPCFGLPPCAQRMLADGVNTYQRVSCFRLAVHLRKAGLPHDLALAVLDAWAKKNRPRDGKRILVTHEIAAQVKGAYEKEYRSCGCEDPAVKPYCDARCVLFCAK